MKIFKPVYEEIGSVDFNDGGLATKLGAIATTLKEFNKANEAVTKSTFETAEALSKLLTIDTNIYVRRFKNGNEEIVVSFKDLTKEIGKQKIDLQQILDKLAQEATDKQLEIARSFNLIKKNIENVNQARLTGDATTRATAQGLVNQNREADTKETLVKYQGRIAANQKADEEERLRIIAEYETRTIAAMVKAQEQQSARNELFYAKNLTALEKFLAIKEAKLRKAEADELARQAKFAKVQEDYLAKQARDQATRGVTMGVIPTKPVTHQQRFNQLVGGVPENEIAAVGTLNKKYVELKIATDNVSKGFTAKNAKLSAQTIATDREREAVQRARLAMVNTAQTVPRLTTAINDHANSVNQARASWQYWGRFLLTQSIHKAVYDIINATKTGLKEMANLQVKISEIRTIGQDNPLDFGTWESEIRRLSDTYGMAMTDVAEGIYQTISNQVAFGANATKFLAESMIFARTTVSSTADAVNLLSSSLNAYGKTSDQASASSASLFKTIEIGRLRASDIANSYGNVAVTAAELGVKEDELGAMMAIMTLQGKKVDVAMTQIRNIMIKMLKPTEELGKYFKALGYESGEAAISAMGLPNLIRKINEEASQAGKGAPWLAKLFGDIRPIQGIISLTGDQMAKFDSILEQYNTKQAYYFKATHISLESTGKLLQIEMNKVHNYFVQTMGEGTLNIVKGFINNVDDGLRGLDIARTLGFKPVNDFVSAIEAAGKALEWLSALYIGWRIRVNLVNIELARQTTILQANVIAQTQGAYAAERNAAAMTQIAGVSRLASFGIFAIGTAIAYMGMEAVKWYTKITAEYEGILQINNVLEKQLSENHAKNIAQIEERVNAIKKESEASRQLMEQATANRVAGLNRDIDGLNDSIKNNIKLINDYVGSSIDSIGKLINFLDSRITETSNSIKSLTANIAGAKSGSSSLSYYTSLVDKIGATNDAQLKLNRTYNRYLEMVKAGTKFASTQDLRVLGQGDLFKRKTTTATGTAVKGLDVNGDAFAKKKKFSKDTENGITLYELAQINERKNALDKMYAAVKKGAEEAFNRRDMTEFAKYWDELIALSDKYETIGKSTGEVIRDHGKLIDERVNKEKLVLAEKQKMLDMLEEERKRNQQVKDDLEDIKTQMGNISTSSKNLPEASKQLDELYKKAQNAIGKSGLSKELQLKLKAEFGKDFSGIQENKKLIETMNEVSDKQVNTMGKLNTLILKQLDDMEKLQQKQDMVKFIEAQRDALKDREKNVQSEADKQQAKMLVPLKDGFDAASQLMKILPKVSGGQYNISNQSLEDELAKLFEQSLPKEEARRAAKEQVSKSETWTKPVDKAFNELPKLFTDISNNINEVTTERIKAAISQVDIVRAGTPSAFGGQPSERQNQLFEMKRILVSTLKTREATDEASKSFKELNNELKTVTESIKGFNDRLANPTKLAEEKKTADTYAPIIDAVNRALAIQSKVFGIDMTKYSMPQIPGGKIPETPEVPVTEVIANDQIPILNKQLEVAKQQLDTQKQYLDGLNASIDLLKKQLDSFNQFDSLSPNSQAIKKDKEVQLSVLNTKKANLPDIKIAEESVNRLTKALKEAPFTIPATPIVTTPSGAPTKPITQSTDGNGLLFNLLNTPLSAITEQLVKANEKLAVENKNSDKLANPPREAAEDLTKYKGVGKGNWKYNMFGTKGMQGLGGLADMGGDTFGDMPAVGATYAKLREASIKKMNSKEYITDWENNKGMSNWQGGISKENQKNNAPNIFDITVTMGGETLAVKTAEAIEKGSSRGSNNITVNGQGVNGATRDQPYYNVKNLNK